MLLDEKATRKQRIDRALVGAGWPVPAPYRPGAVPDRAVIAEFPTENGPADYLLVTDGCPQAIVEAKKLGVGPQNVLQQAQRYARGLETSPFDYSGFHVPFIYASNGEVIWSRTRANRAAAPAGWQNSTLQLLCTSFLRMPPLI